MSRELPGRMVIRHWWVIEVAGYGPFGFYGSASEAEEMRAHKSRWEQGVGTTRKAEQDDPVVQKRIAWAQYEIDNNYPRGSERERAETASIAVANG